MQGETNTARRMRRHFLRACWAELEIVWPVLSGLLVTQIMLGLLAGVLEDWSLGESIYFSFITSLTVGYGDIVPLRLITRAIAILIGLVGILATALLAAISVRALQAARDGSMLKPSQDGRTAEPR